MLFGWLFIGVIIYFFWKNKGQVQVGTSSLDKLKERFVNGEIDEETYQRMKSVIEK